MTLFVFFVFFCTFLDLNASQDDLLVTRRSAPPVPPPDFSAQPRRSSRESRRGTGCFVWSIFDSNKLIPVRTQWSHSTMKWLEERSTIGTVFQVRCCLSLVADARTKQTANLTMCDALLVVASAPIRRSGAAHRRLGAASRLFHAQHRRSDGRRRLWRARRPKRPSI